MNKTLMIVIGLIMTLFFGSMAFGSTPTVDTDHPQTVVVQRGDTLWNIAETVATDDVDIREVVFAMKQMNNLEDLGSLKPGTKIQVPTIHNGNIITNNFN